MCGGCGSRVRELGLEVWMKRAVASHVNFLVGVGKLTVYHLLTATKPSQTDNRLLVVGRWNKNTVTTSIRFGKW